MLKIYCSSCGKATDYAITIPKFCSHCGGNPNVNLSVSYVKPIKKIVPKRRKYIEDEEDDSDYDYEDGNGEYVQYKASITFNSEPIAPGINFKDMQNQQPINLGPRGINSSMANKNNNDFIEDIHKSGGEKSEINIE